MLISDKLSTILRKSIDRNEVVPMFWSVLRRDEQQKDYFWAMDAMAYELLIRQANECGPMDVDGADAHIYRAYKEAGKLYANAIKENENDKQLRDELAYDLGYKTATVVAYIRAAILKVRTESDNLDDDQYEALEENLLLLAKPTKETIDKVIMSTGVIFKKSGLRAE